MVIRKRDYHNKRIGLLIELWSLVLAEHNAQMPSIKAFYRDAKLMARVYLLIGQEKRKRELVK